MVTVQITGQLLRQIFRTLSHYQTFKMEHFAKRMMSECRYATRNFLGQGGEGVVELGHSDKYFIKNTRKRGPAEKHFGFFLLDTL